jgi:hypothetical protein
MDPVTSPLIHKDSGRRARVDPGEKNPSQLAITHSEQRDVSLMRQGRRCTRY